MQSSEFLMLSLVYFVMVLSVIAAIAITRLILGKTKEHKAAVRRTTYVFFLIAIIYLAPIIAMIKYAVNQEIFMVLIIGYSMLLATIPIAYLIIIPLSERKHLKDVEAEFGKDSEYAKYLRGKKKHKKENKKI